jgi:hypothetical protein
MDLKLVSSWYNHLSSVPQPYVQPPERRPCNAVLSTNKKIPVIDLGGHDRDDIIRNIIKSSEEYGFFQVQIFHLPKFLFFPSQLYTIFC